MSGPVERGSPEQALAAARLAAIIESSDDAIVGKTLDGRVTSWNPAAERIFGYTAQEMIGTPIFRLIPPHLHAEEEAILGRIAHGDHVAHYEATRLHKDGHEITISLTVSPVRDQSGRIVGASSIKRDITAQKQAELAMRQTTKMEAIGRLAGGLAHDFNNQLHALSGFLHFIARDPNLTAAIRQDLRQVQLAADRMASLTRQLLAFARQQVLAPETLDLDATVLDSELLLQRLIGSNVEIQVEHTPGSKWIRVDRTQLIQVLLNLAINARDAMPRGGRLRIQTNTMEVSPHQLVDRTGSAIEPGAYARLVVADTGEGIAPEELGRVFEPFYTTKEVGRGTGLGLATVEGIVSQSGGYLQIESAVGRGTSITILFPLCPAPTRVDTGGTTPQPDERRRGRLLVVDDDQMVRSVITRVLRSEGYEVVEASQGKEGLECFAQAGGGIDLVITDLVMPVMGGREFIEQVNQQYPTTAVIWLSGHPRETEFPGSGPAPHQAYLQKPVGAELLISTVQHALRNRPVPRRPAHHSQQ